jgi:neutral amino acid transport system permease protein
MTIEYNNRARPYYLKQLSSMDLANFLSDLPQLTFNGLAVGSIIALAAVGLTLTCGILKLSNFAHGDLMTLGAYLTWMANTALNLNIWLSMLVSAVGTVGFFLLTEQLLWKPMRNRRANPTTFTILSIGLALFLRSSILFIWGSNNQQYDLPRVPALEFGGLRLAFYRLVIIALAVVAIVALHLLLQKTKIGKAMRAVADNIDLARVSGINVETVVIWTWIITGVLTAFGGALYGLVAAVRPNMGWFLILPMFASIILGGIGNPYGAIAGALTIGLVQELSVPFLGADYKLAVALVVMIIILLWRPQGLFKGIG